MPVHEFKVAMTCDGCCNAVKKVLTKLGDKIQDVKIDLTKQIVEITSDLTSDELLGIIQKTGKEASYIGVKK